MPVIVGVVSLVLRRFTIGSIIEPVVSSVKDAVATIPSSCHVFVRLLAILSSTPPMSPFAVCPVDVKRNSDTRLSFVMESNPRAFFANSLKSLSLNPNSIQLSVPLAPVPPSILVPADVWAI